jgi:hypothetical protein
VHTYRDRILHITRASSTATGQSLAAVFLDSMSYQPAFGHEVPWTPNPEVDTRVAVEGGRVRCDVACAFGSESGMYRFWISAPGHQPTWVEAVAEYGEFHGGCPSWNDEGTRISTALSPS